MARLFLASLAHWSRGWNAGNHRAGWCGYLSFFRDVAELDLPEYAQWQHYEAAAIHGSHRYMHARFCVVSDFPTTIRRDGENQPHAEHGPSIAWGDGTAAYYWHGIKIPREWIEDKASIDPSLALTHPQIEMRRCLAEILGWDRVLAAVSQRVIDVDADPEIGTLIEVDLPDSPGERFLRMRCGTGRQFAQAVPPTVRTAIEAQEWIWDLPRGAYRPEVRT